MSEQTAPSPAPSPAVSTDENILNQPQTGVVTEFAVAVVPKYDATKMPHQIDGAAVNKLFEEVVKSKKPDELIGKPTADYLTRSLAGEKDYRAVEQPGSEQVVLAYKDGEPILGSKQQIEETYRVDGSPFLKDSRYTTVARDTTGRVVYLDINMLTKGVDIGFKLSDPSDYSGAVQMEATFRDINLARQLCDGFPQQELRLIGTEGFITREVYRKKGDDSDTSPQASFVDKVSVESTDWKPVVGGGDSPTKGTSHREDLFKWRGENKALKIYKQVGSINHGVALGVRVPNHAMSEAKPI